MIVVVLTLGMTKGEGGVVSFGVAFFFCKESSVRYGVS